MLSSSRSDPLPDRSPPAVAATYLAAIRAAVGRAGCGVRRTHRKQVPHPELGVLDFECQVLDVPDTDQRIIVYCADPDSLTGEVFRRIAKSTAPAASG